METIKKRHVSNDSLINRLKSKNKNIYIIISSILIIIWWNIIWRICDAYIPKKYFLYVGLFILLFFYMDDNSLSELYDVPDANGKT